jgi:hypothetical protein
MSDSKKKVCIIRQRARCGICKNALFRSYVLFVEAVSKPTIGRASSAGLDMQELLHGKNNMSG